ncbi:hypothetical protein ACFVZN_26685 [Streptomyces virginiae]|uniref:hypothetical protein n=1 Tax=Streptomyces virginiae TaxID=1961 RepID=UPI0036896CE2
MLAAALQAVSQILDRRPVPQENGETAGRPQVSQGATELDAALPGQAPTDTTGGLKRAFAGTAALGMLLLLIGLFTHTGGPTSQTRPTTGVGWCLGVGVFLLVTGLILLAARDVKNAPAVAPDDSYQYTCGFPPLM